MGIRSQYKVSSAGITLGIVEAATETDALVWALSRWPELEKEIDVELYSRQRKATRARKATVRLVEFERVRKLADAIREAGGENANIVALNVIDSPKVRYIDHWAHVYRCTRIAPEKIRPVLKTVGILEPT